MERFNKPTQKKEYQAARGVAVRIWYREPSSGETHCVLIGLPREDFAPPAKREQVKRDEEWGRERELGSNMVSFVSGAVEPTANEKQTFLREFVEEVGEIGLNASSLIYGLSENLSLNDDRETLAVRQLRSVEERVVPIEFDVVVGDVWLRPEEFDKLKSALNGRLKVVELSDLKDLNNLRPLAQAMLKLN